MQKDRLDREELVQLMKTVFPDLPLGGTLGILMDVPDRNAADHPEWEARRRMAVEWGGMLKESIIELGPDRLDVIAYPNVGSNNADLPEEAYLWSSKDAPGSEEDLRRLITAAGGEPVRRDSRHRMVG